MFKDLEYYTLNQFNYCCFIYPIECISHAPDGPIRARILLSFIWLSSIPEGKKTLQLSHYFCLLFYKFLGEYLKLHG